MSNEAVERYRSELAENRRHIDQLVRTYADVPQERLHRVFVEKALEGVGAGMAHVLQTFGPRDLAPLRSIEEIVAEEGSGITGITVTWGQPGEQFWATRQSGGIPCVGEDPELDETGRIYDYDTAVHFVHSTTGVAAPTIEAVFRARDEYHLGLGILPPDGLEDVTPEAMRTLAPALFPPNHIARRFVNPPNERAFVVMRTGIDEPTVLTVLTADEAYMRRIGIVHDV